LHSVGYEDKSSTLFDDDIVSNSGLSINAGGGFLGFRTYSIRFFADMRYSLVFADLAGDPRQHSLNFSFGITWRGNPFNFGSIADILDTDLLQGS
jgi:hypothetical protein